MKNNKKKQPETIEVNGKIYYSSPESERAEAYAKGMLNVIEQYHPDHKVIANDDRVIKILLPDNSWRYLYKNPKNEWW